MSQAPSRPFAESDSNHPGKNRRRTAVAGFFAGYTLLMLLLRLSLEIFPNGRAWINEIWQNLDMLFPLPLRHYLPPIFGPWSLRTDVINDTIAYILMTPVSY